LHIKHARIFIRSGSGLFIDAKVPFLRAAHSEMMASIFPSVAELGVNASGFSMTRAIFWVKSTEEGGQIGYTRDWSKGED